MGRSGRGPSREGSMRRRKGHRIGLALLPFGSAPARAQGTSNLANSLDGRSDVKHTVRLSGGGSFQVRARRPKFFH